MNNVLYTIIIYPIETIIELCYLFSYRIGNNFVLALLGVSVAVFILTLPLYFAAEKLQNAEREKQRIMLPKIQKIKAVFSGDEQYMILSAYYKQQHYHPIYALRNTFSLIIQIPFFIAAYHFVSHLRALQGTQFLLIQDLSLPDGLLHIGKFNANILPVLMTLINVVSGYIYSKGFSIKEKIQIFGIPIVFFILLYNSPAALVLYWMCNNIFSLAKNIILKLKHPLQLVFKIYCVASLAILLFVLLFHDGALSKRFILSICLLIPILIPIIEKRIHLAKGLYSMFNKNINTVKRLYFLSIFVLFILCGITLSSALITSSVEEFSFIGSFTSPFPFLIQCVFQSAGVFLFWGTVIFLVVIYKV